VQPLAEEAVDEEFPSIDVLDFVKEDVREVPVDCECGLQEVVELTGSQIDERLIVEIDIGIGDLRRMEHLVAQGRFASAAHADDDLRQGAVEVDLPLTVPRNVGIYRQGIALFALIAENAEEVHGMAVFRETGGITGWLANSARNDNICVIFAVHCKNNEFLIRVLFAGLIEKWCQRGSAVFSGLVHVFATCPRGDRAACAILMARSGRWKWLIGFPAP
jgi:hypothetical protein